MVSRIIRRSKNQNICLICTYDVGWDPSRQVTYPERLAGHIGMHCGKQSGRIWMPCCNMLQYVAIAKAQVISNARLNYKPTGAWDAAFSIRNFSATATQQTPHPFPPSQDASELVHSPTAAPTTSENTWVGPGNFGPNTIALYHTSDWNVENGQPWALRNEKRVIVDLFLFHVEHVFSMATVQSFVTKITTIRRFDILIQLSHPLWFPKRLDTGKY